MMILLEAVQEQSITWGALASLIGTATTLIGGIAYVINSRSKIKEIEIKHDGDIALVWAEVKAQKEQKGLVLKALRESIDHNHDVAMERINKTQDDMKKDREENSKEFKDINKNLNTILGILRGQNNSEG
jgi:predicted permease